ncbi:MAG TPA: glutaredoxin family protein [Burkholderiaceae bacterium]|nr:glutaredoxin family protein [Burkholderiaceae bacterium]
MLFTRGTVCVLSLTLTMSAAADTVYKAVGPDGEMTYSDKPPPDRARTDTLEFRNLPSSPLPAHVLRFREQLEKSAEGRISAARAAPADKPVLFTASWCGHCKRAKSHLAAAQINYVEYDIENADGMRAFVTAGGSGGIPLLVAGDRRIQGYSAPAYDRLAAAIRPR